MVICWLVDIWSTGPDEGGVPESEAPTGISQRWPGSPWGGFGSETVPALAACASTGAGVMTVVGAAGVAVVAGVEVFTASSC